MDWSQQLRAVWRFKWWIIVFVGAATAAGYFVSNRQPDTYDAAALVQVRPVAEAEGTVLPADAEQTLTATYLRVLRTESLAGLAANDATLRTTSADVLDHTTASAESGSPVFDLTGEAGTPDLAVRYANAYARAFPTYLDQLGDATRTAAIKVVQERINSLRDDLSTATGVQAQLLQGQLSALDSKLADLVSQPQDSAQILQLATPPTAPSAPNPTRDAIIVFIVALIVALAAVWARVALTDRYRSAEEAASELGLRLLGEIPRSRDRAGTIEAFRRLRTAITFASGHRDAPDELDQIQPLLDSPSVEGGWTLLVTAVERGVGKTYVTSGLARALAADGWRVVAVDADMRRPRLHEEFGVSQRPGLSDVLSGNMVHLAAVVVQDTEPQDAAERGGALGVLAAGDPAQDATERLSSAAFGKALRSLGADHQVVVLDSPPVGSVVDAVVLARYAGAVVLVIDLNSTRRRGARRALTALRSSGANVLGLVVNRASSGDFQHYGYPPERSRRGERRARARS